MNETELLFTSALGCERADLYLNKGKYLNSRQVAFVSAALKRRIKGEPIQYILGKTEFMGLEFRVNRNVLIPRPETEILVEAAMRIVNSQWSIVNSKKILEIGTGSGCISIALTKFLPDAEITATEISDKALKIAIENANSHGVRIHFIQADLFPPIDYGLSTIDLIISNPPYIAAGEIDNLQPEIKYEPRIALNGGRDGLGFYRRIIKEAPGYLKDNGILILETGFGQTRAIENIFAESGNFEISEVVKDYNNIERVIVGRKKWIN